MIVCLVCEGAAGASPLREGYKKEPTFATPEFRQFKEVMRGESLNHQTKRSEWMRRWNGILYLAF
jgi:hypothetical protein